MGWQVNEEGEIVQDNVSKLKVLSEENMTSDPAATEKATMEGIVDKNDPQVLSKDGKVVNLSFYDNLGYAYTARFRVNGTDAEGNYVLRLQDILNSNNESIINDTYDNEGNLISEGKYDVTIFTGNTDSGTTTFAQKHSEYSVMDGFTLVDNTGKVKLDAAISFNGTDYAKDTILDPVTIFNSDPPADEDLAKLYATAFGFDDYNDLLNLTLYEKTNPNESPMRVGDLLKSGATSLTVTDQNSTTDDTTDDTPGTVYLFDTASKSIITEGYSVPAGDAVSLVYNQTTGAFAGIGGNANVKEFNISIKPKADNPVQQNPFENISVNLEMTSNVNNEKKSTIGATSGDKEGKYTGWAVGTMTGVSIQNDGKIYGAYDNGQTKLLGQIAFATFANAAGLEKEGDNLYSATLNSGEFDGIGVDVTAQGGSVSSGILEMSNVDLSTEFTELITTQRGFQANSRIITVSDTLLEELVNLKR